MYGDGSSNQGQLFEAANMAGLWKLPVIYTIENNLYGMGTSVERASYQTSLMSKFRGYPGLKIDGQNVFMVREATKFCKEFSLKNGPMFMEIGKFLFNFKTFSYKNKIYNYLQSLRYLSLPGPLDV
jgi:pyruvate dehydrogenase E1 component alpha subunit